MYPQGCGGSSPFFGTNAFFLLTCQLNVPRADPFLRKVARRDKRVLTLRRTVHETDRSPHAGARSFCSAGARSGPRPPAVLCVLLQQGFGPVPDTGRGAAAGNKRGHSRDLSAPGPTATSARQAEGLAESGPLSGGEFSSPAPSRPCWNLP